MGHRLIVVALFLALVGAVVILLRHSSGWRNPFGTGVALTLVAVAALVAAILFTPTSGGVRGFTIAWCGGVTALGVIGATATKGPGPRANLKLGLPFTLFATLVASAFTSWWLLLGYFGALVLPVGALVALTSVTDKAFANAMYERRRRERGSDLDD